MQQSRHRGPVRHLVVIRHVRPAGRRIRRAVGSRGRRRQRGPFDRTVAVPALPAAVVANAVWRPRRRRPAHGRGHGQRRRRSRRRFEPPTRESPRPSTGSASPAGSPRERSATSCTPAAAHRLRHAQRARERRDRGDGRPRRPDARPSRPGTRTAARARPASGAAPRRPSAAARGPFTRRRRSASGAAPRVQVTREEYNLGLQAYQPPGISGKVELVADVHYPKGLPGGPYPLDPVPARQPQLVLQRRVDAAYRVALPGRMADAAQLRRLRLHRQEARELWVHRRVRQRQRRQRPGATRSATPACASAASCSRSTSTCGRRGTPPAAAPVRDQFVGQGRLLAHRRDGALARRRGRHLAGDRRPAADHAVRPRRRPAAGARGLHAPDGQRHPDGGHAPLLRRRRLRPAGRALLRRRALQGARRPDAQGHRDGDGRQPQLLQHGVDARRRLSRARSTTASSGCPGRITEASSARSVRSTSSTSSAGTSAGPCGSTSS